MGRNNASKSQKKDKTKVKLSDEKSQDLDSETKKITSHLPKKGDGDAASLKEEQKQKLSRTKKSQKNKTTCSDDSVNKTEASKTFSKEKVPSPKKNTRKRESPRFLPSPLAKIVPIFGKKRHAVQASLSQEDERQESPTNTSDSQTGAEGGIESISLDVTVKEKDEKGEIVPKICSRSDEELRESQCLVTDSKVDLPIVSHETSGESEDVSKGSADEPKFVPFQDDIQSKSDALTDENNDHDSEEDHDKESEIDDYVIQDEANCERDAKEENVKDPLMVINKEEVIVCQAASEEIRVVGQSGSNEDHRERNAFDDSQESVGRGMLRDVAEDGCPVKAEKAGTEHEPIISDNVTCSSIDEIKIHSDSVNIDGNQDVDKEQKWINSPGNTAFVDICTVTGANVPVCIDNEVSKYSPVKDPKCEVNDSVQEQHVSSDRKDGEHVNIEDKEDVHNCIPEGKDISQTKTDTTVSCGNSKSRLGITSDPQHNLTHSELPQELYTRADEMEVGVERVGNVNIAEKSDEGTGDLLMYNPNSNLQCTSTEDMNAPRWDSTSVSSNNPQSCNDRVPQANGNIDGEIDGCSDPLCGSTQQFEVPLETNPSSSQGENAMKICDSGDGEKPNKSDNSSGLQGKGDNKEAKLNEGCGTDDKTTIPSFNLDVPQLLCKKITGMSTWLTGSIPHFNDL
ncbi:cell wall protein IFF6-like [Lytechinus variegatus]|uniref:cell wall protein IFF6-like n=1 Tax=Lytechinus variegatus TaxID=7654 RepID=UPI001BB1A42D|nr:cell wall protein IFF6-like [Lytechinus variegatus]